MSRLTIGVVDYGVGNYASVRLTLCMLGFRSRMSNDSVVLNQTDMLLLPGVGAFPPAIEALHTQGLDEYIKESARSGKPIVGICLGMQLLADSSSEMKFTAGLGLIPGHVVALSQANWHIGWNNIEVLNDDPIFKISDGHSFYFNHSYVFYAPKEYQVAVARLDSLSQPFPVAVRRNKIVGLQFHPEKSQEAGRLLLKNVIQGLCDA